MRSMWSSSASIASKDRTVAFTLGFMAPSTFGRQTLLNQRLALSVE